MTDLRKRFNSSGGTGSSGDLRSTISRPANQKTAPEAPAPTDPKKASFISPGWARSRLANTDSRFPAAPERIYAANTPAVPINDSASIPRFHKHHMLVARWMMPTCTNIAVTTRHHWPRISTAPALFAPQCIRSSGEGLIKLTWFASIARKTAQLMPTSTYVAGADAHEERCFRTGCWYGAVP